MPSNYWAKRYKNRERGRAVRALLAERFPLAFFPKGSRKRPLKVGIDKDIRARCDDLSRNDIRFALTDYTRGPSYHAAMKEGAARVDLDGNPCGAVDASQAAHADRWLQGMPDEIRQRWA